MECETRFHDISIDMSLDEVYAMVGEPESREIFFEGECWIYEGGKVEIVFSGDPDLRVERIVLKSKKQK